ncbi:hypothetical protein AGMMS49938_11120 [Fibrobacterales bacterium]|nr:hypothetical protein AGMMS49938_11120 [Fibrobacterales bacterium]
MITSRFLFPLIYTAPVLAGALLLFQKIPQNSAKYLDIEFGYYAILSVFLWFCIALIWNAKEIFNRVKETLPSRKAACGLGVLLVAFAAFALTQIDLRHRVLSDETSWESMALEMRFNKSGGVCNQGVWKDGVLECRDVVNNFKGKAFALAQSLAFLFLEPNRDTSLLLNLPLALGSIALLFFALFRFTRDEYLALTAAIFLASMPIFLFQSRSASTEVLYVFLFALLLCIYSLVPPKEISVRHFALIIPLLGLFAQTRQETVFCFIPFALYYHAYFREKTWRLPIFVFLVIFASWVSINTMIAYRGYDFQGGEHSAHSIANFIYNFKSDVKIMWNAGLGNNGLLKNPFYTTYTLLLFASSIWLLYRIIFRRKYLWSGLLFALFCLQIAVILFNVSGTFEIDINQRYVLVALPLFAIIMAVGFCDIFKCRLLGSDDLLTGSSEPAKNSKFVCILAAVLAVYLSFHHKESFNANILYSRNMLLSEEDFLNTELKKLPSNSVFIYARPWQMLASGLTGFSERQFLGWSPKELDDMRNFSDDNIYIVRGQDGYGEVNRNSRVVGFKTTSTIDAILQDYANNKIFSVNKPFGYPLEAYKIGRKRGESKYENYYKLYFDVGDSALKVSVSTPENTSNSETKNILATENYELLLDNKFYEKGNEKSAGMHYATLTAFVEGDTIKKETQFFVRSENNRLLQDTKPNSWEQSWSEPKYGKSVEGNTIKIDGRIFEYGIGSHSPSKLVWDINGKYKKFHGFIGLDDESACGNGVIYIVKGDGKSLYKSRVLASHELDSLEVNLDGIKTLELETLDNGDKDCDHANWAGAWLE